MARRVRSAAIYARISSDDGTALGVKRQVEDCRKLAESLGWSVGEEYVDNDVSAYSRKKRPSYERMLADIETGDRDAVIVYHLDRLTRRPIELEQFVSLIEQAGVRDVRFVAGGPVDVGTGDGLMVVRMLSAVAAGESATKSRRVKRKLEQRAAAGIPHTGTIRAYGYERDGMTIVRSEAAVIRKIVKRFLAGESLRSIAIWLNAEGVETVTRSTWKTGTLRGMLSSGRIAGLREHNGEIIGPAQWKGVITPETRDRILAQFEQLRVSKRRAPRRYMLSGLLRCDLCGNRMHSAARDDTRRYRCDSGPDHGGCGKVSVVAPPLEELVSDAVLYRLDTPQLRAALEGRATEDEQAAEVSEQIGDDRAQLDELAAAYAAKAITMREWMTARRPIEDRVNSAERKLARLSHSDALVGVIGNGARLRREWSGLDLTRQAAIVGAVIDRVTVGPGTPGARSFNPDRIRIEWRL